MKIKLTEEKWAHTGKGMNFIQFPGCAHSLLSVSRFFLFCTSTYHPSLPKLNKTNNWNYTKPSPNCCYIHRSDHSFQSTDLISYLYFLNPFSGNIPKLGQKGVRVFSLITPQKKKPLCIIFHSKLNPSFLFFVILFTFSLYSFFFSTVAAIYIHCITWSISTYMPLTYIDHLSVYIVFLSHT